MTLPTIFKIKTEPEKIRAKIDDIERRLARVAAKIETEDHAIADLAYEAVDGDAAAAKRLNDARARRDRFEDERQTLFAAQTNARERLATAESEMDLAGRQAKEKRLRELFKQRMEIARQVWKKMQELRDLMIAMLDTEPEINRLRGELMNRRGAPPDWPSIMRPDATESRLARAAQAMGLTAVFPCIGVSASAGPDTRPYPETEQEACDRAFATIAAATERARRLDADAALARQRKADERRRIKAEEAADDEAA